MIYATHIPKREHKRALRDVYAIEQVKTTTAAVHEDSHEVESIDNWVEDQRG